VKALLSSLPMVFDRKNAPSFRAGWKIRLWASAGPEVSSLRAMIREPSSVAPRPTMIVVQARTLASINRPAMIRKEPIILFMFIVLSSRGKFIYFPSLWLRNKAYA